MSKERYTIFEKNRQCGQTYIRAFKANTTLKQIGDRWECECNKFLWSVSAPTKMQALLEGSYYFNQYYSDGEYND